MRVKLLSDQPTGDKRWPDGVIPAGTILDEPDSFALVKLGIAEPAGQIALDAQAAWEAEQKTLADRKELERQKREKAAEEREAAALAAAEAEAAAIAEEAAKLGVTIADVAGEE